MRFFKITFEYGNTIITGFNGSLKDAEKYYLGRHFNIGFEEEKEDNWQMAVKVEEISQ